MASLSERMVDILRRSQIVPETDLKDALASIGKEGQNKLREVLVKRGLVTEKALVSILSLEIDRPFLSLERLKPDPQLGKLLQESTARQFHVVPVSKIGMTLTVAVADPFDVLALDELRGVTHCKIECVLSSPQDIETALDRLYSAVQSFGPPKNRLPIRTLEKETAAPCVKMVDRLLNDALKNRASDIHIEPLEKTVRVRFRIDGNLREIETFSKKDLRPVLTRVKIMSKLDITESRLPQDGRLKIKMTDREVDCRVSVLPVMHGGKVVMRILDKTNLQIGLENLGFLPETLEAFKAAVKKPFGMILVTGPTGSGKSTTLYSILNQLNTPEKNIITIEDPIEYQVRGITQIQTRSEVGLDFAKGLRATLRQSPDVVMVGEIRDAETADIAIKASLTGQLVLSTLHTNDAAGAMTRLVDMGVEPFLIASSVILVAAQRLVRNVCPSCKKDADIPTEVLRGLAHDLDRICPNSKERIFLKGQGCARCNGTGYYGRMGILETLVVTDELRDLVTRRASSFEIKEAALKKGMTTLRDDALKKFCMGRTTLEEVLRVTSGD